MFVATTATEDEKPVGGVFDSDTEGKQPCMFGTPSPEHEKSLHGPSIATLRLFGQGPDDSALGAVSA